MTTSHGPDTSSMTVSNGTAPSPKARTLSLTWASLSRRLISRSFGQRAGAEPLARLGAAHLAARRARNGSRRRQDDAIELEAGGLADAPPHLVLHVAGRRARPPLRHRDDLVGLVEMVNREDDDARRPEYGQLGDRRFEIGRVVLPALADDEILRAPAHEELAVGDVAEIARRQPSAAQRVGRRGGILEVA